MHPMMQRAFCVAGFAWCLAAALLAQAADMKTDVASDFSLLDPALFDELAKKFELNLNSDSSTGLPAPPPEKPDPLPILKEGTVGPIIVGPIEIGPVKPKGLYFPSVNGTWSTPKQLCVRINQGPVDVYFLADTTGSMYSYIASVKTAAAALYSTLNTALTNLQLGVGDYKDVGDIYTANLAQPIAPLTSAAFVAAVNSWTASGGGDWPEAFLYALSQVATSGSVNWRSTSTKAVVWFGDAPGHDPSVGATLSSTTASLQAKGIKVIALDCQLLNYMGQAAALATSTGGQYFPSITAANISATIVSALMNNIVVTVKPIVTCPANSPLLISFNPPILNASAAKPGCFDVSVKVCTDLQCLGGSFSCTVTFVDAATNIPIGPTQTITANVPSTDTTPPVISPAILTPSVLLECPGKWKFQDYTATDNCGPVKIKETVFNTYSSTCPADHTETHTWTAIDAAGNVASTLQSVTWQDTTPPFLKPKCAKMGPICLGWVQKAGVLCIDTQKWSDCFDDTCSKVRKTKFSCGNCTNGLVGAMTCKVDDATGQICFKVDGLPREGPNCCNIMATATDDCGNTATYPFPEVCVYMAVPGTRPPSECSTTYTMPVV